MKRFLLIVIVALAAFAVYWFAFKPKHKTDDGEKMTPLSVKKHSESFNRAVADMMTAYISMKDAFVEDDTSSVKQHARSFIGLLDSIPLDELKKDTTLIYETAKSNVNDIKSNAQSILAQTDITEMRHDFNMVTDMMYPSFFKTINYEGPNIYLINCPMAFGEDRPANWISNSSEVINPYMGKHQPAGKENMLHCGSVKDSIKTN
ncbi:MAG: DUF3347 domain-containing protein [Bacteroidetes bacterium]|jgi:hypothetical protein|nr:DUF3347 domain-containing protein [Bacteroidota bacterium]